MILVCPACGFENDAEAVVCTRCEQSLERRCPACRARVPAGSAFCGSCGRKLDEPAGEAVPGDRRTVTAIFADISGYTALAERLDPEDVSAILNDCFTALTEEVQALDGWLEKYIGDALVAVFGAPLVHEDDPVRAVRAGLAMQERMRELNERLRDELGRPLELHIGINTGLVVMGPAVSGGTGEMAVLGDTMNVAARLQQVATAGQLLVSESTYALTSWAFDYERLPPLQLKGKQRKLTAYRCLGVKAQPRSARGFTAVGLNPPLVGRDAELAVLAQCLERVRAGQGGIVAVVGEAGLGKTRVADEARKRLPAGVRWLEGRALSYGRTISYLPFLELVKADAAISEEDAEEVSFGKLERRIGALFGEDFAEILPYLAVLLGLEVKGELAERVRYLDGEGMRHQIFRACRLYVERLARECPTVLAFEDFHWADQSSEELLEHLLPLVQSVPLLVLCRTRQDPDSPGGRMRTLAASAYQERYRELVLSQLSPAESARLVQNLLAIEIPPRLRQAFEKGEGNPFFLEEVVRSLIDLGAVVRDESGRFRVVSVIEEITIPGTIEGVIMARVDRLDEEAKQVLRTASVIGRSFFYQVLRSLEVNGRLDRRLSELERHELIRQKQLEHELEYIFKHALTQEAIYGSILLRRRRELHARVGAVIESLFAERIEEFYAVLAYHFAQAEQWEKAQDYLFKAGDRAGNLAADAEALTHYQQALAAYERVFGERWDPLERAILERKMGEALFRRGEHKQAREHLMRALADLNRPYPRLRRRIRLAILGQLLRQVGHRRLPALFLRRASVEADARAQELARLYETIGWIDFFHDEESHLLDALLLANSSERNNFPQGIVAGATGLGFALNFVPLFGLARQYHRRALALAEELQHPTALGFSHLGLGFHEHRVGRFASAREHFERAMDAYLRAGELRKWAAPARLLAQIQLLQGEFKDGFELGWQIARTGEDAGDHQSAAWGLNQVGETLWRGGAPEQAVEHLQKAIDIFETIPDYSQVAVASGDLAQSYMGQDRLDETLELLEETNRLIAQRKVRGFGATSTRNATAEAYLRAAERAQGSDRASFLNKAKRACKAARKQGKLDRQAFPAAYRLQGRLCWLQGKHKKAENWWQRSFKAAEELGAAYEVAMTLLEAGRRTGDRAQEVRGEALLNEMRAQVDLTSRRRAREGALTVAASP